MTTFQVGALVDHQAVRDALVRLVAALDAWDGDVLLAKVDLERAGGVDAELAAARDHAHRVLGRGA